MSKIGILRSLLFSMSLKEANFISRGFSLEEQGQQRLELVAKVVLKGYNTALKFGFSKDLEDHYSMINKELSGFFYEGSGMGLYTLDLFMLNKKNRFWEFIKQNKKKGIDHEYMSYIGAGIACGVFNKSFEKFIKKASPTSGLLVLNGIGFYYGYFKYKKTFEKQYIRKDILEDSFYLESYDNGLGRALWFCKCGNPDQIAEVINKFPEYRKSSIWSGIGLAATYAGGRDLSNIIKLKEYSGKYSEYLGQGSFLATHARDLAKNKHISDDIERILIGKSAIDVCKIAPKFHSELNGERFLNKEHSLKVFYEKIRYWIKNDYEN